MDSIVVFKDRHLEDSLRKCAESLGLIIPRGQCVLGHVVRAKRPVRLGYVTEVN